MEIIYDLVGGLNFVSPVLLYLLIPLGVGFIVWVAIVLFELAWRPERTYGSKYPLIGNSKFWGFFVLLAAALMAIALARPNMAGSEIRPVSGDAQVVVLLDTSLSMRADDIRLTRLEVAQREILRLDGFLRDGDKIGLFIFGKSSFERVSLSGDLGRFFDNVSRVRFPENLSGDEVLFESDFVTVLEHVYRSLDRQNAFSEGREYNDRYVPRRRTNQIVLLFSDGEDHFFNFAPQSEQEELERNDYLKRYVSALEEYRKRGLKIYPVGIGTRTGSSWLSILRGYDYPPGFDEEWAGQTSRLDRDRLSALAKETGASLSDYDWTVENAQGSAGVYLEHALNSNRRLAPEFVENETGDLLWQYCLLIAVVILVSGIATYPFSGYLRRKRI